MKLVAPSLALLLAACSSSLPAAPPHTFVAAQPHAPPMELCWVEYGNDTLPGAWGVAGDSDQYHWDVTYSGLLVRHPSGHVLIDTGRSSHFSTEIKTAGTFSWILLDQFQGGGHIVATAPDALRQAGEDPAGLKGIAISHIHGDHASGLMDIPGIPVYLAKEELDYAKAQEDSGGFDVVKAHAIEIEKRAKPIVFEDHPYEIFDKSFDLFGDGSVVFVPLFGHTPGSMGTFVNRSAGERYFHVGDAFNTKEAIDKARGKSAVLSITDHDGKVADAMAAQIVALHTADPGLVIIPAHDRKVWQRIFGAPSRCIK